MKLNNITKIILSITAGVALAYVIKKYYFQPTEGVKKYLSANPTPAEIAKEKELLVKECKDNCSLWDEVCNEPCKHLGAKLGPPCKLACKATTAICNATCTGKMGLRNASLHHIMIYDKNKKTIAQLGPVDPRKQALEITDFPITVTRCGEYLDHPNCPVRNESYVLKIEKPGCYILWGATPGIALYTTKGAC